MTNLQQFVSEYAKGPRKDLTVPSTIYSNATDLVDDILNYSIGAQRRTDWDRISRARSGIANFSLSFLRKIERLGLESKKYQEISERLDFLRDGKDPKSTIILMT